MSEEKKMILKMLEEGKINSEEATRLIEALDEKNNNDNDEASYRYSFKKDGPGSSKSKNFQDEIYKIRDRLNEWKKDFKNNYNQKEFDKLVDEFSVKAEKFGKNIASTTVNIVDRMVDFVGSFVDTNSFNNFGNFAAECTSFSFPYCEDLELTIIGTNGQIVLKTHQEESIKINSRIKSSKSSSCQLSNKNFVKSDASGNIVKIKIDNPENINLSVSHEIFVPQKKIQEIKSC